MSWKKKYGYYKISLGLFVLIFYFCKNPFVNRFDLLSFSIENFILFPNYVLLIFYILFFIDKNKIQDTLNSYRIDDQMIIDCLNNFHKYMSIKLYGKWWIVNRIYIYINVISLVKIILTKFEWISFVHDWGKRIKNYYN